MCDQPLFGNIEKQTSSEDIQFSPPPIRIGFTGPTIIVDAIFASRPNQTKAFITNDVSIESKGSICKISDNQLTLPAIINIGKLKTGPYTDTGGPINFKDLFYYFFDLNLDTQITYQFDASLICNQTIPQTYNIDNKPFQVKVNNISFDKSRYFATNTDDETNINKFQQDLVDLFSDANKQFVEFFNAIATGLLNETSFGRNFESKLDQLYCNQSTQETPIVNTYILFEDKIKRMKRIGISFREFI